ncbi:MAG: hypothetical protein AAGD10_22055, partial [Myxococcota bacterium]
RIIEKYVPILLDELHGARFKAEVKESGLTVKIDGTVNEVDWSGGVVLDVDKSDGIKVSVGVTGFRADMDDFYASYLRSCSAYAVADFYAHLRLDSLEPDADGELVIGDAIEFEARNASFKFKNFAACWNRLKDPQGNPDTVGQTIATFLRDGFDAGAGDMLAEAIPALAGTELMALTVPIDFTELYESIQTEVAFNVSDASVSGSTVTVTADVGTMSMCVPPEGAPTLGESYHAEGGTQFPQSQVPSPWLLGAGFSTSLANQVLKSQIECGLLQEQIQEIDIFNNGSLLPTTVGFLSILIGALNDLIGTHGVDPLTLVRIEVLPSLAPIMTSDGGPNGEQFGLTVPQFLIRLVNTASISNFPAEGATPTGEPEQLILEAAVDFSVGVDVLTADGEVSFEIGLPDTGEISAVVVDNPFGLDAPAVEGVVPGLVAMFVPALVDALGVIPLPELLGEQVVLSEPYISGEHVAVYATLDDGTLEPPPDPLQEAALQIYYNDNNEIWRADVDVLTGSGGTPDVRNQVRVIADTGAEVSPLFGYGLGVDEVGSHLYWSTGSEIMRSTLGGNNIEPFAEGLSGFVWTFTIDEAGRAMYWIDSNGSGYSIWRADLDTGGPAVELCSQANSMSIFWAALEIDATSRTVVWYDEDSKERRELLVQDLDELNAGTGQACNPQALPTLGAPGDHPVDPRRTFYGLAATGEQVYWLGVPAYKNNPTLRSMPLDGTEPMTTSTEVMSSMQPYGIDALIWNGQPVLSSASSF